uniref:ATP-dependent DNA ligase family profile domain-containing protein n=1 Tax=Peronospora matthiolae TaxID=2874970 RepID=A0AAV1TR92_9STRA
MAQLLALSRARQTWRARRSLLISSSAFASSPSLAPPLASVSPTKARHHPHSFESLAHTFRAVEHVKQSRVTSTRVLAQGYRQLLALSTSQEPLASALYLTASQLAPPYEGVELQFGTKSFVKILKQFEVHQEENVDSTQTLEQVLASFSDYGLAMQSLLDTGRVALPTIEETEKVLCIQTVHAGLMAIAQDEGAGSSARKQQRALKLLQQCRCSEARVCLARMLAHQNLRMGMGEKSILSALAMASTPLIKDNAHEQVGGARPAQEKEWVDCVTQAYAQHPNYSVLAQLIHQSQHENDLQKKIKWMRNKTLPATGVPVLTMSAYPMSSVEAVLDRIAKSAGRTATCEYKYDGARVQVHLSLGAGSRNCSVRRIFSRNMEDITARFSTLLDALELRVKARDAGAEGSSSAESLIVEGEVVALDRITGTFHPFQVLQTKTTTEFCLFLFDLLAVDGKSLLQKSLRSRRALLHDLLGEKAGYVEFVKCVDISLASADETRNQAALVRKYLAKAVATGCEGLMIKLLDGEESEYKAGRRSHSWMKLKHDYVLDESTHCSGKPTVANSRDNGTFLADTLDLVPIGAFYGKGRRAGLFGSFLMATYNSTSGKFETIGKVGTGFSDASLMEVSARFRKAVLPAKEGVPEQYRSCAIRSCHPDVWVVPEEVWEIKATQLTESSSYTCGTDMDTDSFNAAASRKGLALRFPRFVRFRPDKKPLQATESEQVKELFQQQQL